MTVGVDLVLTLDAPDELGALLDRRVQRSLRADADAEIAERAVADAARRSSERTRPGREPTAHS